MSNLRIIENTYRTARQSYAEFGVDTDKAIETLSKIAISLHCWQGDDITGFENLTAESGGGIQATGNYPGKARNADELRSDLEMAYNLIPGRLSPKGANRP